MAKPKKILSKDQILEAQKRTKSNRAAARYLHVSWGHYKSYSTMYKDEATGKSLHELHANPSGRGIPKFLTYKGKEPDLMDVLEGRIPVEHYTPEKIKDRIIREGLLEDCCHRCRFSERRLLDTRIPLILNFKNKDKKDYSLKNIELLCYNCYFLYVGNIFTTKQIQSLEDFNTSTLTKEPTWQLDEHHIEHLKELGLYDEEYINGSEYIVKL
jgi:hypothetical protein